METNNYLFKRRTLSYDVVDHLIDCILKKQFKPGDRIIETKIAKELQVSQGVIREAICKLVTLGFIKMKPYKGARVRNFTMEELKDYYNVRLEIEKIAVKWAVKRISSRELNYLQELIEKMIECAKEGDYLKQSKIDLEFHRSIIHASGSRSLERTWKALGVSYWGYIGVYLRKLNLEEQAIRHQLICDALRDGDAEKVESVIKEHFSKVKISLLEDDCTVNKVG